MKLGVDALVVRTPFEDFSLRIARGQPRPVGAQLEQARWAVLQVRAGIERGDPQITWAVGLLMQLLDGESTWLHQGLGHRLDLGSSAGTRDHGSAIGLGGLAARVEHELLFGRLVVERQRLDSLNERELEFPELPALGPGAQEEPTTSFIAVRLVDQDGKPVIGRRWAIELPDGSAHRGHTDPDGWARLAGFVKDGVAKVRFPDFDEIDTETRNAAEREVIPIDENGVEEQARAEQQAEPGSSASPEAGLSFLDLQIVDLKERPLVGRKYELTLPDGSVETGVLGDDARVRRDDIPAGKASIRLLPEPGEPVDGNLPPTDASSGEATEYSVRVVAADGSPIVGVTMAFAFGNATRFAETNADGIAALEGPSAPAPLVSVADVAELRRIRNQVV